MVEKYNYSVDISIARSKKSIYSFLFLRGLSPFKWEFVKYKVVFRKIGFFKNSGARKRFVKALLTTNSFPQQCNFCKKSYKEILQHQLCECKYLELQRQILKTEVLLYGGQTTKEISTENLKEFISCIIHNKHLVRCFTNFLQLVDF